MDAQKTFQACLKKSKEMLMFRGPGKKGVMSRSWLMKLLGYFCGDVSLPVKRKVLFCLLPTLLLSAFKCCVRLWYFDELQPSWDEWRTSLRIKKILRVFEGAWALDDIAEVVTKSWTVFTVKPLFSWTLYYLQWHEPPSGSSLFSAKPWITWRSNVA